MKVIDKKRKDEKRKDTGDSILGGVAKLSRVAVAVGHWIQLTCQTRPRVAVTPSRVITSPTSPTNRQHIQYDHRLWTSYGLWATLSSTIRCGYALS